MTFFGNISRITKVMFKNSHKKGFLNTFITTQQNYLKGRKVMVIVKELFQ